MLRSGWHLLWCLGYFLSSQQTCLKDKHQPEALLEGEGGMQTWMPVLAQGTGIDEVAALSFQGSLSLGEGYSFVVVTAESREQPRCPLAGEWIPKMYNGVLFIYKET